jgi:hypothetical protein
MNRQYARKVVLDFEAAVEANAMAGAGHPDLIEWHGERLAVARERMIRRVMGLPADPGLRMPDQPEVEY